MPQKQVFYTKRKQPEKFHVDTTTASCLTTGAPHQFLHTQRQDSSYSSIQKKKKKKEQRNPIFRQFLTNPDFQHFLYLGIAACLHKKTNSQVTKQKLLDIYRKRSHSTCLLPFAFPVLVYLYPSSPKRLKWTEDGLRTRLKGLDMSPVLGTSK